MSTVERTIHIATRPEVVWRYWTDPARICTWWGAVADLDPRPGGVCQVELFPGAVMMGEYLELVPYERIVFTMGWEQHDDAPQVPPGSTTVEVTLVPDRKGTTLTLTQRGIPEGEADRHGAGWDTFLPRLVDAAGGAA